MEDVNPPWSRFCCTGLIIRCGSAEADDDDDDDQV